MKTIKITDNSIDNWVLIEPTKQIVGFIPTEQELYNNPRTSFHNGTDDNRNSLRSIESKIQNALSKAISTNNFFEQVMLLNTYSKFLPIKYAGIINHEVGYNINPAYANFFLYNLTDNNFTDFTETITAPAENNLYNESDTEPKLVNISTGLQALRIPADKFKIDLAPKYGKWYIAVMPKYIETEISNIYQTELGSDENVLVNSIANNSEYRNINAYIVDKNPFISDTVFNLKQSNNETFSYQTNILLNSIVEIYRGDNLLTRKTIIGDNLNFNNNSPAILNLGPDMIGWDSIQTLPSVGDKIRIFPKEYYFKPINIEVDFVSTLQDIETAIRYLKNDTVRNLETNEFEVYNDNGITIDSSGNIEGKVIMKYQIGRANDKEFRKNIKI